MHHSYNDNTPAASFVHRAFIWINYIIVHLFQLRNSHVRAFAPQGFEAVALNLRPTTNEDKNRFCRRVFIFGVEQCVGINPRTLPVLTNFVSP